MLKSSELSLYDIPFSNLFPFFLSILGIYSSNISFKSSIKDFIIIFLYLFDFSSIVIPIFSPEINTVGFS